MRWRDAPVDPHDDARRLVDELLSAARLLIDRFGEILPMGALIGPEGELEQVPCSEGIYEATVLAQVELLRQAFMRRAEKGELRASAVIYDPALARVEDMPTAGALTIEIEHFTGHNITMTVPYQKSTTGLVLLAPIVSDGVWRVFPRRSG